MSHPVPGIPGWHDHLEGRAELFVGKTGGLTLNALLNIDMHHIACFNKPGFHKDFFDKVLISPPPQKGDIFHAKKILRKVEIQKNV